MQILVIAATKIEIEHLEHLPDTVDIEITGVGVPSTMYHLQKKLQQKSYGLVIQAGIAGTFTDRYSSGDVVTVRKDSFADIGIEESSIFTSIYQTTLADKDKFPFTNGWLVNKYVYLENREFSLVNAVTVNKVSDSELQKQQLIHSFSPDIESMEGAALHYVCLQENISFLQIRGISNQVGIRDKSKWKMKDAITNLNNELNKLIRKIS